MTRWIVAMEANLDDESREEELNTWYEQVHVPDALEFGCLSVTRLRNREPADGRGRFTALYEMESDDVDQSIKDIEAFMANKSSFAGIKVAARIIYAKLSDHVHHTHAYKIQHSPGS